MTLENRFACFVISSCSSRGNDAKVSYFVPMRTGIAVWCDCQRDLMSRSLRHTLLKPLACLYHSFTLFRVAFRVKSNMKRMATASLDTSGSMETNSR
jgi:hypothetical protein